MSGHAFMWRMRDPDRTQTLILHQRLTVIMYHVGADVTVRVNAHSTAERATDYMLGLTSSAELNGLTLAGMWTQPAPNGGNLHLNLRTLFTDHIKDAKGAPPLVHAIVGDMITGRRLA